MARTWLLCGVLTVLATTVSTAPELVGGGGGRLQHTSKYVVIDAGSSGCRLHVYTLTQVPGKSLPQVELPDKKLKKSPGLSSFENNPDQAGASLQGLLEFAKEHVPAEQRPLTPIRLAATAGLRLLPKATADRILDSCYKFLKEKSTFRVTRDKISVISGRDEGAYGWLAINFLLARLEGMDATADGTVGSIEMGGASSQVTVQLKGDAAVKSEDASTLYTLEVAGYNYSLYTHSYLGFGQEQARSRFNDMIQGAAVVDPCFNKGYSIAPRSAASLGTQFTCFPSTKVQMLTQTHAVAS